MVLASKKAPALSSSGKSAIAPCRKPAHVCAKLLQAVCGGTD